MEPLHPCSSSELLEALRETEGARFSEDSPDVLGGWGWGNVCLRRKEAEKEGVPGSGGAAPLPQGWETKGCRARLRLGEPDPDGGSDVMASSSEKPLKRRVWVGTVE